jgi:ADP-heptose:LPS heptosyltransferase
MALSNSSILARWLGPLRRVHAQFWLNPPAGVVPSEQYAAVIMKPDGIGDFILAMSAIRLVLQHHGEQNCALLIAPAVEELARLEFPRALRIVIPAFPRHKRAFTEWRWVRRRLANVTCGSLVCLRHQRWDYHELMLSWIRSERKFVLDDTQAAAWTVGRSSFRYECEGRIAFTEPAAIIPATATGRDCRELRMHRRLLAGVLGEAPAVVDILPRFAQLPLTAAANITLVAPLTGAQIKDMPVELLEQIVRRGELPVGKQILLTGSPDQAMRLEVFRIALNRAGRTDVHVETATSIINFVRRVASADLVLTADTAAAHVATALDRPTVVVIGGGHYGQFGPWYQSGRQIWLTVPMDCFGCGWRCIHPEPYCLTRITPEQVFAAIRQVQTTGGAPT